MGVVVFNTIADENMNLMSDRWMRRLPEQPSITLYGKLNLREDSAVVHGRNNRRNNFRVKGQVGLGLCSRYMLSIYAVGLCCRVMLWVYAVVLCSWFMPSVYAPAFVKFK